MRGRILTPLAALALSASPVLSQQPPAASRPAGIDIPSVRKAVVTIQALDASGQLMASGTGFFVTEGFVVTAAHVLEGAAGCRIELTDGQQQRCSVAASDSVKDVAMLTVSGTPPATLRWGASEATKDGDEITVISNPLGQLPGTVSRGIISASRVVKGTKLLQISAAISHGSSGAPVLNTRGQVIGIVRSTIEAGQSLNFATATDAIRNLNNDQVAVTEGQSLLSPKTVVGAQNASSRSNTGAGAANIPQINIGQTLNGTLTSSDSLYPDNSYFKFYSFTAPSGPVTIDLSSDDFDPVLIVRGADLDASVINDDGGPGCSARISRSFPSRGPYRILVNTTSDPEKQIGQFSLSITQGTKTVQLTEGNADCRPPQRATGAGATAGGGRQRGPRHHDRPDAAGDARPERCAADQRQHLRAAVDHPGSRGHHHHDRPRVGRVRCVSVPARTGDLGRARLPGRRFRRQLPRAPDGDVPAERLVRNRREHRRPLRHRVVLAERHQRLETQVGSAVQS